MLIRSVAQTRVVVLNGDITEQDSQAIVNAANSRLAGGGGVDGAIHRAGGPAIMEECRAIGGCATGEAVITTAGRLKAKKVIHTVGPVYQGASKDAELLASCYRKSLQLAADYGLKSISFPSISTGAYGYPLDKAAAVAVGEVLDVLKTRVHFFEEVRFVLFGAQAYSAFEGELLKRT